MKPSTPPETAPKNPAPQQSITFDALNTGVIQSPNSLDADVDSTKAIIAAEERQAHSQLLASEAVKSRRRLLKFIVLGVALLIGLGFVVLRHNAASKTPDTSKMDASQRYSNTSIPLASLDGSTGLSVQNAQTLSINGQLNVNNSLVIAPAARPHNAVTGQLYFDQSTNKLTYYNGQAFVSVATNNDLPTFPASVSSLGGATGAVSLNNGLSVNGNTLSNTGVLTLQGESGNISLVAGNGIAVSGTTLSNTGLLSLGGAHGDISLGNGLSLNGTTLNATAGVASINGTGNIAIIDNGNGNFTITTTGQPGMGSVTSAGGTTGKLAVFDGVQDIADSLVSQSGTVVTVGGDLQVTGSLNLTNPLAVTNGGTGANTASGARTSLGAAKSGANSDITSLTGLTTALSVTQGGTGLGTLPTNSVLIGNGTSPLTGIAGTNGQCLVMSGTTPTFATCPGSGGVSSVDGLSGGITIANTTGTGSTITINDAGSSAKGIASFNATNFLVTSGAVNTVQDIAVTSTPTFANLNLTNPLGVSSGGTGRNSLTSNGVLVGNGTSAVTSTTGTNGQCLVITGTTPGFTTCPGSGGVTTVNSANGAITIQGTAGSSVSTVGGVITINDATATTKGLAAFNSTNFSVTSGTVNTTQDIATTSAPSFAQLSIVSSQATGKMLTINNTNAAATGNLLDLQLNGTSKLTVATNGTLNTNGNLSVSGTVSAGTINGQTIGSTSSFTGGVNVAGSLAVNTIANTGALTVGVGGQSFTLQGNNSSMIKATNGTNTTTVAFQSPTANVTYNFGAAAAGTYDVCTTAGNCVGAGGGVTSTGGTTNKLAKFTGSNTVGDSIISDNGSTVTISGSLSVNTITPTGSLTVGSTGQNLTLQGAAVTLSATSAGITNSLVFAAPGTSNKTITLPNASGTVAVSASGPLVLDSFGNLSCPTCLSGGAGGGSGVSSLNGLSGALTLQGSDAATFSNSGTTITVSDASATVKGVAKFNGTNLTVTSGSVNTIQDIAVTAAPTFAGLTLSSALTVGNGGTGATNASGARTNLGAAASGINADITQITGLTTALSVAQGGTGIATTPTNGQILIGNGTGFSLNTLTAGAGVNITNAAGTVTISAPGSGTCTTCANTSLSNLASVAINTSLLPGTAGAANLGSATLPFGQLFLSGTSASPAANNFKITGAATAARIITLPDASGTVAVSASGYLNLSAAGNLSFTGTLAVADGGTGANNASGARTNLGAAASGANSDITSLSGLTTALSVAQGGTGLATLTANQLLYASSSSTAAQLSNGTSGLCLISNGPSSAPSFQTCTGAGGVSSVDGLSGALSINNTSGTGSTITINDAAADGVTKGIATFNSTNFSAISGVVNTIQGIATTSTPTFAGLTLNGTLTANTITPTGAMVIGSASQSLTLQGSAASTITATGGGFTTTIGFSGVPAGNVTYNFDRTPAAGTYTICTTAGNCLGGSGGAKTDLSNLTTTSINQSLLPSTTNTLDFGSTTKTWRNGYFGTGVYAPLFDTVSAATLNIGTTNATSITLGSSTTVSGTLNSVSGYKFNGTSGSTVSCTSGNVLQNAIVQGGIITGGTCVANGGGFAPTLQNVYDNSGTTNPQIQLSNANGGLKLRDAASSTISNLFQIQNSAGSSTYFAVTSAGIKAASIDTVAAGTLAIGNTNATTINIGSNNVSHTINIGTSTTADQFISIGNYNGGSTSLLQGNSLYLAGNNVIMTAGNEFLVQDSSSNQLFIIEKQANLTTIKTDLQVNGWQTTIGGGTFGQGVWINNGGLTVAGTTTYTSPAGASLQAAISVTNQDLGGFGSALALGVTAASNATARGIIVADARTVAHQPTIGILDSTESTVFGLSYDGGTVGLLKTTAGDIGIAPAGTTVATFSSSATTLKNATTVSATTATAFQIQNTSGTNIFSADTVNKVVNIGVVPGAGVTLVNSGATVNMTLALGNFATGGAIGTAAATVDVYTSISVGQTTANQTLSLPTPSNTTGYGHILYLSNIGSTSFTILGTPLNPGSSATFIWSNTNGGAKWQYSGADGNSILNQTGTTQTANFTISGTGIAATLQASSFDTASAVALNIGSTNAASITLAKNTTVSGNLNTSGYYQQGGTTIINTITATGNTFIGNTAGNTTTTGNFNTAVGYVALSTNTTGTYNAAYGLNALNHNTTGQNNTALGSNSLQNATTGTGNTAVGNNALKSITTGGDNTAIGDGAGYVDYNSKFSTLATVQNASAIGAYAQVQANNTMVLGSVDLATQVVIGATKGTGTNTFGVSPVDLNSFTVTASQTSGSGTITASAAIFNARNVGQTLIWADGTSETITAYTDSTHVTASNTSITETNSYFRTQYTGFQVTNTGTAYIQGSSASAFQVQNATGTAYFNVDTSTSASTITLGSVASGNYITFTAAGGLTAFGTAQHAKTISLSAEYAGAVLYGGDTGGVNCSTNQNGYMTSGYDTGATQMSYYNWSSIQATGQCYDVIARVAIPTDFASWNGAPSIKLKTDSTANSAYAIGIIKSDGSTYDSSYGSAYTSPGTLSTSWANMATSSLDSTGYTAGGYMTIRIRMTALNNANLQLGDIVLTYNSKF